MLIDWVTVAAQVFNFLILVWLLKRYLYKPILDAVDARERLIAKELADAAAKKTEAQAERDDFQRKNEEFDQQRAGLLSQATDEAKTERQRLLDEARQAADALRSKRLESLSREFQSLSGEIARRTQQEVFAVARQTLRDLAGASLEERATEVFVSRLRELNGKAKETLSKALNSSPAVIRSAFELPPEQRAAVQTALNETFSAEVSVQFLTAPEIIGGIELTGQGQKIAWSIADYLSSLERGVGELLAPPDQSSASAPRQTPKTGVTTSP